MGIIESEEGVMYGLAGLDNDYLLHWQWRCIGEDGHNDVNIQNSPNYFKQIVNTQKICIKYSLNVNICLSIIVPRFCCKSCQHQTTDKAGPSGVWTRRKLLWLSSFTFIGFLFMNWINHNLFSLIFRRPSTQTGKCKLIQTVV